MVKVEENNYDKDMEALNPEDKDLVVVNGKEFRLERLNISDQIKMAKIERNMQLMGSLNDKDLEQFVDDIHYIIKKLVPDLGKKEILDLKFETDLVSILERVGDRTLRDQGLTYEEVMQLKEDKKKHLKKQMLEMLREN
jgi:hypothetical protein